MANSLADQCDVGTPAAELHHALQRTLSAAAVKAQHGDVLWWAVRAPAPTQPHRSYLWATRQGEQGNTQTGWPCSPVEVTHQNEH